MDIGWSQRDITPLPGEELGGYGYYINRRADRVLDPLFCRVCAFRENERVAVLIQFDLIGLTADHVREIRERLGRAHNLKPEAVFIHCTHTHCAPATHAWFGPGEITQTWRQMVTKHTLDTVADALKHWEPVQRAYYIDHEFPGIAHNRDEPGGPVEKHLRGLLLEMGNAAPILLVNYGCHPVALGVWRVYSADYPGAAIRYLNALGYRALYLTGPCGDLDPLVTKSSAFGKGGKDVLNFYGRRIADAFEQALVSKEMIAVGPLQCASRPIDLSVEPPARSECEKIIAESEASLEKDPTDGMSLSALNGTRNWIKMLDSNQHLTRQPVEVQSLNLGGVTLAGIGAEYYSELNTLMRAKAGIQRLLVAGTCNAVACYIATRRSIENKRYAGRAARFYGVFPHGAGAGERFAEDAGEFLAGTASRPK